MSKSYSTIYRATHLSSGSQYHKWLLETTPNEWWTNLQQPQQTLPWCRFHMLCSQTLCILLWKCQQYHATTPQRFQCSSNSRKWTQRKERMLQCDGEGILGILMICDFSKCAWQGVRNGSHKCKCNNRKQAEASFSRVSHAKDFWALLFDARPSKLEASLCYQSSLCNPNMMRCSSIRFYGDYQLIYALVCRLVQGLIYL